MYKLNIKERKPKYGYWEMIAYEISNKNINHQVYLCNVKHQPWVDLLTERDSEKYKNKYMHFSLSDFSDRQFDVCNLVLKKLTCRQIGNDLHLTRRTVEAYIFTIRTKFVLRTKNNLISRLRNSNFRKIYKIYLNDKS